jgi:hypothetical protein
MRLDSARLKSKILDKLDNLQFVSQSDINGYIIYLEDWMMEDRDATSAILGQESVTWHQSGAVEPGRANNGIIHGPKARILFDWVDFFVIANHPQDLLKPGGTKVIRNQDRNRASEAQIRNLFENGKTDLSPSIRTTPGTSTAT